MEEIYFIKCIFNNFSFIKEVNFILMFEFDLQRFTDYTYFSYGNYAAPDGEISSSLSQLNTHRYTRNDIREAVNDLDPRSSDENNKVMLATNIFIYSNGSIVGMIQSFTVNETRQINKLQAVGWEGVVQAVPSNTRGGTLNVSRIALYDSTLYSALGLNTYANPHNKLGSKIFSKNTDAKKTDWDIAGYNYEQNTTGPTVTSGLVFRTLRDQRAPLEIAVKTRRKGTTASKNATDQWYTTTYVDSWIQSYSKPYTVGQIYVTEQATIAYGDVY